MAENDESYLVLCVDRDDDLGNKAKVDTPVVGREATVAAGTRLALADPEEADANAIFAAVKKYDELAKSGSSCEVAIVCGDARSGFDADRRIGKEVETVLGSKEYTGVVLVSDGGEDEYVIPIVQSLAPIVSVERVAVKHSETVEETYQVLGRYLRMLVFDPRYSKWALGVPGLILVLAGVLIIFGQFLDAELAILLIVGGAFLVRGFSIDRTVALLLRRGPTGYIRLFSMAASLLIVIVGILQGYNAMVTSPGWVLLAAKPSEISVYGAQLVGDMIGGSLALVWGGVAIYFGGALLSHIARQSRRWRRDGYLLLMLAILYFPFKTFSVFLENPSSTGAPFLLVSYVLIGLAAIFALTVAIYPRVRTKAMPLS